MYRKQFPSCKIIGSIEPIEFGHMLSKGMIPQKCYECELMFEGECRRNGEITGEYARLDYGKCKFEGKTNPVSIEIGKNSCEIFVPSKCKQCEYLKKTKYRGYFCTLDNDVWADFPRSLDWGDWEPDFPIIGLGDNI